MMAIEDRLQELRRLTILDPASWKDRRLAAIREFVISTESDAHFLLDVSELKECSADIKLLALERYREWFQRQQELKQEQADEEQRQKESRQRADEYARNQKHNAELNAEVAALNGKYPTLALLREYLNDCPEPSEAAIELLRLYQQQEERKAKAEAEAVRLAEREAAREHYAAEQTRKAFEESERISKDLENKHLEEATARDTAMMMALDGAMMGMRRPLSALGRMVCNKCGGDLFRDPVDGRLAHRSTHSPVCPKPSVSQ